MEPDIGDKTIPLDTVPFHRSIRKSYPRSGFTHACCGGFLFTGFDAELAKHLEAHRNGFPACGFIFTGPKLNRPWTCITKGAVFIGESPCFDTPFCYSVPRLRIWSLVNAVFLCLRAASPICSHLDVSLGASVNGINLPLRQQPGTLVFTGSGSGSDFAGAAFCSD